MVCVDAHVHVFEAVSDAFPRRTSELAPAGRRAPAEMLLREMDAAGVDRAVLIDTGGTGIEQHRYVTHCVQRWPDRFTSTGLVDVQDPEAPGKLRALVEATGVEGIRVGGDLGDPVGGRAEALSAFGLFQVARELGLNVNVYGAGTDIRCVALLAAAFPEIAVSLDHLGLCPQTPMRVDDRGRPWFDEPMPPPDYPAVLALARYPNVYVKLSGEYAFSRQPYPYGDLQPVVRRVYEAFGPGRMMWATDFPWIVPDPGYGRLAGLVDRHLPDRPEGERDLICGGTAMQVWFRGRGGGPS